jgi:hypothetical protein
MSKSPRPFFGTEGRLALVENSVYTVFQGDAQLLFPRAPSPNDSPNPSALTLQSIWDLGWVSNYVPFMPLVPLHKPFYGTLFSRLHYDRRTIPVVQSPDQSWGLELEVIREWEALERILRALLSAMMTICDVPLTRFFRLWSFPKQYGYELAYRTYGQARFIALRSRDAFVPLMASISFMLIVLEFQEKQSQVFNWRDQVLARSGIHYQWLADLESSAVGDFDAPKVGGIIDMETCQFKSLIPLLRKAKNMPIYLHWGAINNPPIRAPNFLSDDMIPCHRKIVHLRSIAEENAKKPSSGNTSTRPSIEAATVTRVASPPPPPTPTPPPPPPPKKFPPVEPYSGQGKEEDWRAFFARRAKQDELKAQRETAQQKQNRMARIANALKDRPPGKKGARVYTWEDVDGFLVRRSAGRKHYSDIWDDYSKVQRKYDSFRDEWDLCPALDPTGQPDFEDDEYDDPSWVGDFELLPGDNSELLPEGIYSSSADLERVHGVDQDTQSVLFNEAPDDLAYYRFGFVSPIHPAATPNNTPTWAEVSTILGNGLGASWAEPSSSSKELICVFFGYHKSAKSPSDMPEDICDLQRNDRMASGRVIIRCERLSNKMCYILERQGAGADEFVLVVTSAATVMEIVRRGWGPDLQSIMSKLFDRGIAFNLCYRDAHALQPPPKFIPRFGGLGYRPKNYQPDRVDYMSYKSSLDRFLSSSRGRAAVLRGGLIARLARDIVTVESVTFGPSDFPDGSETLCLWDGNPSSLAYWDDQLTADEVDVICGVYRVDTGEAFKKNM